MLSRLPRNAPAWLDRLSVWLEPFEVCFTHIAQRGAFRRYLLGLTLLRQIRAAGFEVTAVLGDAEFGDSATLRRTLHRLKLPYALGISSTLTVFRGTPPVAVPLRQPRVRTSRRLQLTDDARPEAVRAIAAALPPKAWRRVTWRNGTNRPWAAHFAALRVTPAHDWRTRRLAPEVWLLFERDLGSTPRIKAYLVDLPATASRPSLVRLAHHRWAIEQQYEALKDELGLDHFEGARLSAGIAMSSSPPWRLPGCRTHDAAPPRDSRRCPSRAR